MITVHQSANEIEQVVERVKRDSEHKWWKVFLGWSPIVTGFFNIILHPVVVILVF